MRYLCPSCNKSKHQGCKGNKCECKCRRFRDTATNIDNETHPNPKLDEFVQEQNKQWAEIHEEPNIVP